MWSTSKFLYNIYPVLYGHLSYAHTLSWVDIWLSLDRLDVYPFLVCGHLVAGTYLVICGHWLYVWIHTLCGHLVHGLSDSDVNTGKV